MKFQKYLDTIDTYECAMMDKDLSNSDFDNYMKNLTSAREKFFYSIADQAIKNKKLHEILVKEELQFVQFQTVLLINKSLTNSQFLFGLDKIVNSYTDMKEFDANKKIYNAIIEKLLFIVKNLRVKNETSKIDSILTTLNNFQQANSTDHLA